MGEVSERRGAFARQAVPNINILEMTHVEGLVQRQPPRDTKALDGVTDSRVKLSLTKNRVVLVRKVELQMFDADELVQFDPANVLASKVDVDSFEESEYVVWYTPMVTAGEMGSIQVEFSWRDTVNLCDYFAKSSARRLQAQNVLEVNATHAVIPPHVISRDYGVNNVVGEIRENGEVRCGGVLMPL